MAHTKAEIRAALLSMTSDAGALGNAVAQLKVYHQDALDDGAPVTAAAIQRYLDAVDAPQAELKGIAEGDLG